MSGGRDLSPAGGAMAKLGRLVVVGLMLLNLLSPSAACADGFRNPFQSAVAVA